MERSVIHDQDDALRRIADGQEMFKESHKTLRVLMSWRGPGDLVREPVVVDQTSSDTHDFS